MTLTFKMTPEDYNQGFKIKSKKCKLSTSAMPISLIFFSAVLDLTLFLHGEYYYGAVMFAGICLSAVLMIAALNKAKTAMFEKSPILTGRHTITADEQSLTIINSFEKMTVPWKRVYYVKLTSEHIIILPTYRKGVIVINKSRYDGKELEELTTLLKEKTTPEGDTK